MKRFAFAAMTAALFSLSIVVAHSDPHHDMTPEKGSKELETIKGLEGHWEGTSTDMGADKGTPGKVTVDYHVTSGGSAVVETLMAGTPHEMVSIYHDENGHLVMTHYCLMHNQPRMSLKTSTPSEISLELAKDGGVDPKSDHMHAITLQMPGANQLVQKWTSYEGGKASHTTTFTLTRKI